MNRPKTAGQLQQFYCAASWMRQAIPSFAEIAAPLHQLLENVYKTVGSRKRKAIAKVPLKPLWKDDHDNSFDSIRAKLLEPTKLAHIDSSKAQCLYTDASDTHWAGVLTQVPKEQLNMQVKKQEHEPLAFISGAFKGHSEHWSMPEKEAFAIVESMKKLDHITAAHVTHLYTDHSNLTYIFDPYGSNTGISKHTAHKLLRWALKLRS